VTRPALLSREGYQQQTVEKVERLLELLGEMYAHPLLGAKTLLHGGTALNVFHLEMPRLSVDADVQYVGAAGKEQMLAERGDVMRALVALATSMGYEVAEGADEHAGRTYRLHYAGEVGRDTIKIDLNFLNRVPVLGGEPSSCKVCSPGVQVRTFKLVELVAGKTKALFERVAMRDLYDIHRIALNQLLERMAEVDLDDARLCRRVILYYVSLSDPFPYRAIDGSVVDRFANRQDEAEQDLYPVLHASDRPGLAEMMKRARTFIDTHVMPQEEEEYEYLRLLGDRNDYEPRLLFGEWEDVARRAEASPAARWKQINLAKRPSPDADTHADADQDASDVL